MTIPAIPLPKDGSTRTPVDFTLKSDWSFDTKRRVFVSAKSEEFSPLQRLPEGSRIVYKVPSLAKADVSALNEHERALRRYLQLILPEGVSAARYLRTVRAWPSVEEAHVSPEISLPVKLRRRG